MHSPLCGDDPLSRHSLKDMLTDRDSVVKVLAAGKVRRLPVIDGRDLVEIISQVDLTTSSCSRREPLCGEAPRILTSDFWAPSAGLTL